MMGHNVYLYEEPVRVPVQCEERAQISRYAADHGVAFPDLLNTDVGQLHTRNCASFLQKQSHGTEMIRGTCPTIVVIVKYRF